MESEVDPTPRPPTATRQLPVEQVPRAPARLYTAEPTVAQQSAELLRADTADPVQQAPRPAGQRRARVDTADPLDQPGPAQAVQLLRLEVRLEDIAEQLEAPPPQARLVHRAVQQARLARGMVTPHPEPGHPRKPVAGPALQPRDPNLLGQPVLGLPGTQRSPAETNTRSCELRP